MRVCDMYVLCIYMYLCSMWVCMCDVCVICYTCIYMFCACVCPCVVCVCVHSYMRVCTSHMP